LLKCIIVFICIFYQNVLFLDGPLTITDANLVLGRLLPENFPKIFGKNQNEPLDLEISRKLFGELTLEVILISILTITFFQSISKIIKLYF
jgi:N-methylhydantoinase A/oxoprolinase/acetone carboxylase beta subunit